jgi:hypothetical protein
VEELKKFLLHCHATKTCNIIELRRILFVHQISLNDPCPLVPSVSIGQFLSRRGVALPLPHAPALVEAPTREEITFGELSVFDSSNILFLISSSLSLRELTRLFSVSRMLNNLYREAAYQKLIYLYEEMSSLKITNIQELYALDFPAVIRLLRIYEKNPIIKSGVSIFFDHEFYDVAVYARKNISIIEQNELLAQLVAYKLFSIAGISKSQLRNLSRDEALCGRQSFRQVVDMLLNPAGRQFMGVSADNPIIRSMITPHFYDTHAGMEMGFLPGSQANYATKRDKTLALLETTEEKLGHTVTAVLTSLFVTHEDQAKSSWFPALKPFLDLFIDKKILSTLLTSGKMFEKRVFLRILDRLARYINCDDENERRRRIELITFMINSIYPIPTLTVFNVYNAFPKSQYKIALRTFLPFKLMFILAEFKDLISLEQMSLLVKLGAKTIRKNDFFSGSKSPFYFRGKPVRRFVEMLKSAGHAHFDYYQFFRFIINNKLNITFRWNREMASLFLFSNFLSAYSKLSDSQAKKPGRLQIGFWELKDAASIARKLTTPLQLSYDQWCFVLKFSGLFNPRRVGGALPISAVPIRGRCIAALMTLQTFRMEESLDASFVVFLLRCFNQIPRVAHLSSDRLYLDTLPDALCQGSFRREEDCSLIADVLANDAMILEMMLTLQHVKERLQQLLAWDANTLKRLLQHRVIDGVSLLRWVLYLPKPIFDHLMQADSKDIAYYQDFILQNKALCVLLNPRNLLSRHEKHTFSTDYFSTLFSALQDFTLAELNQLSEITVRAETNLNGIMLLVKLCQHQIFYRKCEDPNTDIELRELIRDLARVMLAWSGDKEFMARLAFRSKLLQRKYLLSFVEFYLNKDMASESAFETSLTFFDRRDGGVRRLPGVEAPREQKEVRGGKGK